MLASQDESVKPRLKRLIDESIALGDDSALGSIVVEIVRRGETSVRSSREELLAAAEGGSGDAKAIVTALGWREYNDMQVLAILPPAQAPTPRAVHTALSEMLRGLEDPDHFYNALSRAVRRSVFTSEPFSFIPLLSEERLIRGLSTFLGFGAGIQNFFVTGANFSCRPISEKTKAFLSPETVAQYHSIYDSRLCHYHSGEISLPDCSKEG